MEEKKDNQQYKYKITTKKPIGKGSFSTVYQAINKNNEYVAVKCISLDKLKNHDTNKFLLELDISLKMKHLNIVKCHEVFKTSKKWYIVCEYCDSGTLSDIIKNMDYKNFSRELVCKRYLTQLKNALKYLYRNNIIHRDLKPTNILISGNYPNDTLKLADFGFSRYFIDNEEYSDANQFMMTSFCGTPMYMAPEMLFNKKYTNKADLWSFGIIMYEMLYGKNPFNSPKNIINLMDLIKLENIEFEKIYSNECISLLKSLLQIDPNNRIEWEIFFRHKWFDKQIPTGFSTESLPNICSSDNIYNVDSPILKSPDSKNNSKCDNKFKVLNKQNLSDKNDNSNSNSNNYNQNIPLDYENEQEHEYTNRELYKMEEKEINYNEIPLPLYGNYNEEQKEYEEEFDIINKDEIVPCSYNTYNEEETNGYMKILSTSIYNSVYNILWKK